jgi:hypothetical protein
MEDPGFQRPRYPRKQQHPKTGTHDRMVAHAMTDHVPVAVAPGVLPDPRRGRSDRSPPRPCSAQAATTCLARFSATMRSRRCNSQHIARKIVVEPIVMYAAGWRSEPRSRIMYTYWR